jgi:hypothetical protein
MGNVLRVLGIVVASMLLGLAGLTLALFTICGGLESSDGAGFLAGGLAVMAGAVAAIVILGRGLTSSRSTARGLAVAPVSTEAAGAGAGAAGMPQAGADAIFSAPPAAPPATQVRALSGTDRQVLLGLRIALAVYIVLSIGSMAASAFNFRLYGSSVAIQLMLRNLLALLPPVLVLVAVSVRTPPAGAALDAAAGLGIASILFRFGFVAFSGLLTSTFTQTADMAFVLLRLAAFSAIEAAVAGLALHLRSRQGRLNGGAIVVAVLAFLLWDGLVQVAMQMLATLMF